MDEFGIWNPAVIFPFETCARVDGDDGLTHEAARRRAWNCSLGNDGTDSVCGIDGSLAALLFVGYVDQDLDETPIGSLGDVVGEGMDDDVAFGAQQGFVVSGIIQIAGEAGVVPEEDGCGAIGFVTGG